jgi:ferredoxin
MRTDAMKVIVDHNLCEGNGRCIEVAPEVFDLRDDDRSYVVAGVFAPSMRAKVELAVSLCPRQAIRLIAD